MAKLWEDLARKEKIDELYMAVNGLVATNRAQAVRLARALERIVSLEKAAPTVNEPRSGIEAASRRRGQPPTIGAPNSGHSPNADNWPSAETSHPLAARLES